MKVQTLVEIRKITSRFPSGQVKTTTHDRFEWVDSPAKLYEEKDGEITCSPSTSYEGQTMRIVK